MNNKFKINNGFIFLVIFIMFFRKRSFLKKKLFCNESINPDALIFFFLLSQGKSFFIYYIFFATLYSKGYSTTPDA